MDVVYYRKENFNVPENESVDPFVIGPDYIKKTSGGCRSVSNRYHLGDNNGMRWQHPCNWFCGNQQGKTGRFGAYDL